jgi:hypothetical protein
LSFHFIFSSPYKHSFLLPNTFYLFFWHGLLLESFESETKEVHFSNCGLRLYVGTIFSSSSAIHRAGLPDGLFSDQNPNFDKLLMPLIKKRFVMFHGYQEYVCTYISDAWYSLWSLGNLIII